MKLLLDTHALIWWWLEDPKLSRTATRALADNGNTIWVSAASAWEIMTKQRLGKLPELPGSLLADWSDLLQADGFQPLAISIAHALRAGSHPAEHRDPFDRLLAAQAEIEGAALVTRDPAMAGFGVRVLW